MEEHALERRCSVDPGGHEKLFVLQFFCILTKACLDGTGLPANDMTVRLCQAKFQVVPWSQACHGEAQTASDAKEQSYLASLEQLQT
jgi:hypothetical protein